MKVYLVSDGEYSDYRVLGVFSTLALAEEAQEIWAADNAVEEFELDATPPHPPGLLAWSVWIDREGNARASRINKPLQAWFPAYNAAGEPTRIVCSMWATDEQHAIKIANEQRLQLLASGQFDMSWEELRAKQKAEQERKAK